MTTQTHTPGPWAILDRSENSRTLTHVTNGAHIVCTLGTTRTDGSPNHSANARLIAAAPDMLDALQAIVDYMETAKFPSVDLMTEAFVQDSLLIDQCKAALAKAKETK